MSWDGGWVHIGHVINTPGNKICCVILTPEGDVTSSAHIRGSWVGLSVSDSGYIQMKEHAEIRLAMVIAKAMATSLATPAPPLYRPLMSSRLVTKSPDIHIRFQHSKTAKVPKYSIFICGLSS